MMKCELCHCNLRSVPIVTWGNFNIYGTNWFCPNPKCDYEFDSLDKEKNGS